MSYVSDINTLLKAKAAETPGLVIFGQNVVAGSCLGGLTRGLPTPPGGLVLNTPNSENTLVGAGFGLALQGLPAVYFLKQLDFLLLGLDHLVNTGNMAHLLNASGSFTAFAIIVDSGFEGPQSCLNTFGDFCSMANLPGYAITSAHDAAWVINTQLAKPGCRIVGVSQRLFGSETLSFDSVERVDDDGVFRYRDGDDATVASFNFALPQAKALADHLEQLGASTALYGVSGQLAPNLEPILTSALKTRRLAIVDDSKSVNRTSDRLIGEARAQGVAVHVWCRQPSIHDLAPNSDRLEIDTAKACSQIMVDFPA
jgi:pyruvate dehydrogenase E1 component beta subunit